MTIAFACSTLLQGILSVRSRDEVGTIQKRYIPQIELSLQLNAGLVRLRRGFQDSVSAQDRDALARANDSRKQILSLISSGEPVFGHQRAMELSEIVEKYCAAARSVSERLIAGQTGIDFPKVVVGMQELQAEMERKVRDALTLDRGELVKVFERIDEIQARSIQLQVAISVVCLFLALFLSALVVRGVLRSVSDLSVGLRRFGQGDFSEPIPVSSGDELGDVAEEANRMAARTRGLLKELDSFSYSVAHDLRAPIRGILGFAAILIEDHAKSLPDEAAGYLNRISGLSKKMGQMVDSLLGLSRLSRSEIKMQTVSLTSIAEEVFSELRELQPGRAILTTVSPGLEVRGDPSLLRIVLTNLLGNAWKFTSKNPGARVEVGVESGPKGRIYFVRDNGAGFDMQYAGKLFGTFQRLHAEKDFEGTGIGLATVQTIIGKHGGEIWAEAKINEGAVFYFTLGKVTSGWATISSLAEARRERSLKEEERLQSADPASRKRSG